jgi:Transposase zinc-binding domain
MTFANSLRAPSWPRSRTAALGGHATQGEPWGPLAITAPSWGNRHCPKCPGPAPATWLAARDAALLDVPYVQGVLPLPPPTRAPKPAGDVPRPLAGRG